MEKILSIEEAEWSGFSGYSVTTDAQVIRIGIQNGQACCETWGYLVSEDHVLEFVGASLLGISLTDTALNTRVVEKLGDAYVEASEAMFVTIDTTVGPLQFAVYNSHNGHYGHDVGVWSNQLAHEDCL